VSLRTLLTVLSAGYLVSMMFALGLELGGAAKESKAEKRAKRRLLVRGFVFSLVLLPLVTLVATRALHASGAVTVALVVLAACPGGRYAPHLVTLGGGDTPLSVEITLWLAKLTCFTAVPTVEWMLTQRSIELRELPFLLQLVLLQLVPLLFGKWVRRTHRSVGDRLFRPAHWFAIGVALVTLVLVLLRADRGLLQLLDARAWLAVAAVGVASPIVAWAAGGSRGSERRTFAVEANARELALALAITSARFSDHQIQTALFGVWSIYTLASFLLALALRSRPGTSPTTPAEVPTVSRKRAGAW
jgi:BASS family bile acid:Na+ symporter